MANPAVSYDLIDDAKDDRVWLQSATIQSNKLAGATAKTNAVSLTRGSKTSGVEVSGNTTEARIEKYKFSAHSDQMSTSGLSLQEPQNTKISYLSFIGDDAEISHLSFAGAEAQIFGRRLFTTKQKQYIEDDSEHFGGRLYDENGNIRKADQLDLLLPLLLPSLRFNSTRTKNLFRPLRKNQLEGISFLIDRKAALLADEMGLGKTVQAILALRVLIHKREIKNVLIVVKKANIGSARQSLHDGVPEGWSGHLALWAPELVVKVVEPAAWDGGAPPSGFSGNTSYDRRLEWKTPAHVYLTTYDLIRNDIKKGTIDIDQFDCTILDEVHSIKNPNSQQSQALHQLNTEYRWGLSGTPIQNKPGELYAIFQFLLPSQFPPVRPKDLNEMSLDPIFDRDGDYYLRRNKSEDLPPKIRHDRWTELDDDQKLAYEQKLESGRTRIRELVNGVPEIQVRKSILGLVQKLKGICNFSPHSYRSPKLDALVNLVESELAKGNKILVFSQYLGNGIEKIFPALEKYGCVQLVGSMTTAERNEAVTEFRRNDEVKIFLGSLHAGGVGLHLTSASVVIHFDHWWNPAVMWQAEDRAHRQGQTKPVDVYSFWIKNTIEERIYKILERKDKLIRELMAKDASEVHDELEGIIEFDEWLEILEI